MLYFPTLPLSRFMGCLPLCLPAFGVGVLAISLVGGKLIPPRRVLRLEAGSLPGQGIGIAKSACIAFVFRIPCDHVCDSPGWLLLAECYSCEWAPHAAPLRTQCSRSSKAAIWRRDRRSWCGSSKKNRSSKSGKSPGICVSSQRPPFPVFPQPVWPSPTALMGFAERNLLARSS